MLKHHLYKLFITLSLSVTIGQSYSQTTADTIRLADPTIFQDSGTYYLYGTGSPNGFPVFTSTDLMSWQHQGANALQKGDAYGSKGFWAPQIFKHDSKYYMAYTADEHIAIAESNSPLGPFAQKVHRPITMPGKQIDPYIFEDTDGKMYLYFVRLQKGNRIFVTRLKDDLSDVSDTTATECIHAENGWENTANSSWPVSEGPTVAKINGVYYLFYSANDFRNIDYAVGYATASSPMGPWIKYTGNPIISRKNTLQNGSGHGDLFTTKDGRLYYVFHTHSSNSKVGVRKTAIAGLYFTAGKNGKIEIVPGSFRYLKGMGGR